MARVSTWDRVGASRRFLAIFLLATLLGTGLVAMALYALHRKGLLPPPPITATWCFNDKFAFLRDAPLSDLTLVAVGSSATWRNLDMSVIERRVPGTRAINAAPCFLHVDQTAYLAEFLLPHMPQVNTVLTVLAPRDFEVCTPAETRFFEPGLTGVYISGTAPSWLVHVVGFRPFWLMREAWRVLRMREEGPQLYAEDAYGSSVLRQPGSYWPEPTFDPRCYDALTRLEAVVTARGARLVIATVPVMPAWAAAFDPDGRKISTWMQRMRASLHRPETMVIDGRALAWGGDRFADPAHVLYPNHTVFTEFIAATLAQGRSVRLAGE